MFPGDPCPNSWTRFNGYCYLVSSSIKSWSQAQAYCRSMGGNLVKINHAEENEFVLNLVQKKAPSVKQVWIGLKWVSHGFYWYDYSVPVYTNWAPHEPNGKAGAPCSQMWVAAHGNGAYVPGRVTAYWNDIPCHVTSDLPNGIVCKKLP